MKPRTPNDISIKEMKVKLNELNEMTKLIDVHFPLLDDITDKITKKQVLKFYKTIKNTEDLFRKTLEANNQRLQKQRQEMMGLIEKLEKTNEQLQKEKEQSAKLAIIGERASQMNHNLRNPLSVIMMNAEVISLLSKKSDDCDIVIKSQNIKNAADSMLNQINDLMNFIKCETLQLQNNSLHQILDKAISLIKIPNTISIQLPKQDVVLKCDKDRMQVVFMNIFTNAIEAMEDAGKIIVRSKKTKSGIIIEIEDSGPGISHDALPRIFETLFTTKKNGTGLGLSYCKNTIVQHGGTISASINPTIFAITLPKS